MQRFYFQNTLSTMITLILPVIRIKKKLFTALSICALILTFGGCGKKQESLPKEDKNSQAVQADAIFTALNNKHYEQTQQLIQQYVTQYPESENVPSFRLMLADSLYEQQKYSTAHEAYKAFEQFYPADQRAEYAAYKAAHARFAQANHVTCDARPTEDTITLCQKYLARADYRKYRRQMENLERTCQQRLIDKDLYVANTYLNQNKLMSARRRLVYIKEHYDLEAYNAQDKLLFYEAKLAKQEDNQEVLSQLVENLHANHPQSHFTAMADRLSGGGWF